MNNKARLTKAQAIRELERRGWTQVVSERPGSSSVWAVSPDGYRCLGDPRDLLREHLAQTAR
jgi:hypothetical protein